MLSVSDQAADSAALGEKKVSNKEKLKEDRGRTMDPGGNLKCVAIKHFY